MPTEEVKQKIKSIKETYKDHGGGFFAIRDIFDNAESVQAVFLKLVEHALAHHLEEGKSLDDFDLTAKPVYGIHKHASNATLNFFSRPYAALIAQCAKEVIATKKAEMRGEGPEEMRRR